MSDTPWPPSLTWPPEPLTDGVVLLDRMTAADAPRVALGCADPQSQRWLPLPNPYGEAEALAFMDGREKAAAEGTELTFALRGAQDGLLAGAIGLMLRSRRNEAETGYWLTPDRRGKGMATRAVRLLARFAFANLPLNRIEILVAPGNDASVAVAVAAGATAEGLRRNGLPPPDNPRDALVFSLLPEDVALQPEQ